MRILLLLLITNIIACGNVKTPDVVMREELSKLDQLIVDYKNRPVENAKNELGDMLTEEVILSISDMVMTYCDENKDSIIEFLVINGIVVDIYERGTK